MTFSNLLDFANHLLIILILLSGAIGFLFRTFITEWLKNKLSKAVNKELENEKHKLSKELEAYKVSLIRDMEQFKANVDIQRSIALKMADARLEAIRELYSTLQHYGNEAATMVRVRSALRKQNADEYSQSEKAFREAIRAAHIFLPAESTRLVSVYFSNATALVFESSSTNDAYLLEDDPRLVDLRTQYVVIANQLRVLIYETPALALLDSH